MSAFSRWMCSATGAILSSAKRRNVSCTISKSPSRCRGPGVVGQRGEERRGPVGGDEARGCSSSAPGSTPQSASRPNSLADQLADGVGDERAGDAALELALGAVVEHRPAGLDRRGGVGQVVGDDLVDVRATGLGQVAGGGFDDAVRGVDGWAAAVRSGAVMAGNVSDAVATAPTPGSTPHQSSLDPAQSGSAASGAGTTPPRVRGAPACQESRP